MEKATSSIRRSGAFLWSIGAGYQELNLIISELKSLKSHTKAVRDSQATIFQDLVNWACNNESSLVRDLVVHILELNAVWYEIQSQFAEQITEFRRQFEMILEGEKIIDAARSKFAETELAEQKARKKLKKIQKKEVTGDISAITNKIAECERQREIAQTEVSQKIQENEAVKLLRLKEGLVKLSDAYLALSHKCIYVYEGHKEIVNIVPDVEDREIHELRYDGPGGAKEIVDRARERVKEYSIATTNPVNNLLRNRRPRNLDPPPPYSPNPYYQSPPPFNPYFPPPESRAATSTFQQTDRNEGSNEPNELSPNATSEELAGAMSSAVI